MDYTKLMYDAANRTYAEIGERHGYTGLTHGLAAVSEAVGRPRDSQYFSRYHHDPLAGLGEAFERESLSFPDLMRQWDSMWFGHGTGRMRPLSYPFDEISWFTSVGYYGSPDLDWIVREVARELKAKKIRRGSLKYNTFVSTNAHKVVDAAAAAAMTKAEESSSAHRRKLAELEKLLVTALDNVGRLHDEAKLRAALLRAADLRGAPLTDQEFEHQLASWTQANRQIEGEVKYLRERIEELADANKQTIATVEQMSHMPELRPFVVASGLVDA